MCLVEFETPWVLQNWSNIYYEYFYYIVYWNFLGCCIETKPHVSRPYNHNYPDVLAAICGKAVLLATLLPWLFELLFVPISWGA